MRIRQVKEEDIQAVTKLEAYCFPLAQAASEASLRVRIQTFPTSFLVIEEKGELIGMINGCVCNQTCISDDLYEDARKHQTDGLYQ